MALSGQQLGQQRHGEAERGGLARLAAQLVQATPGQPAVRQGAVDSCEPQRQDRAALVRRRALEPGEHGAQPLEAASLVGARRLRVDLRGRWRHGQASDVRGLIPFVPSLF
jgi:hypothetical protein